MKKQINFRPIFYCFIALGLGIYFARSIFSANIYIIFALSLALIALTVICIKYKCVKRLIILCSTFVLGVGIFALSLATFSGNNFTNGTYTVSGRIVIVNDYSGMQNVILDNVYIDGNKSGNMSVSVTGATTMEEGYVITFTGYIEKTQLFSFNKFNNYYYKYKIVSTAKVKSAEVTMDDFKGLTLSENLRKSIKLILDKNMSPEDASISYASLFGDKTYISDEVRDSFSISGIAHLLAVSGLHIGFLTTALLFLLNRTKLKRYVNVIIISIFLVFYCYLCSFSVSVVRASIMFLVLSLANVFGKQYDKLNSIGLAGIVVLLYKPLSVFDPGFLLSFGCVLGIFMFTNYFKNLFTKWHFPKKLCDTLSIMFAVQLGILPLTIYYYGQLSLLTMLANFICIPVFEIFFISLFAIVPIVAIIPFLSFLLKFPAIIISFIIKVAQIIASQKWAIINLSFVSPFALVGIYVVLFIYSQFINLSLKQKFTNCSILLIITFLITMGLCTPIKYDKNVTVINAYGKTSYIVELNSTTFCIGNYDKYLNDSTEKYFNNIAYKSADYLLAQNSYIPSDDNVYNKVYHFSETDEENVLNYNYEYDFNGIKVKSIYIAGKSCGVLFNYDNFKVFVCSSKITFENMYTINYSEGELDLLISNSENVNSLNELNTKTLIYNNEIITKTNSTKMQGSWTLTYKNAKIDNIRSLNWIIKT